MAERPRLVRRVRDPARLGPKAEPRSSTRHVATARSSRSRSCATTSSSPTPSASGSSQRPIGSPRLSHPGVIRVLDAGVLPDGRPYLALPLLHGETLAARLARGPLPDVVALAALLRRRRRDHRAASRGPPASRSQSPRTSFSTDDDRLVLLDFGIARDPDASPSTSTQQGQVRGTPAYMAPERFFGVAATEASEVYELAATLHVMLAGALPWATGADLDARLDPKLSAGRSRADRRGAARCARGPRRGPARRRSPRSSRAARERARQRCHRATDGDAAERRGRAARARGEHGRSTLPSGAPPVASPRCGHRARWSRSSRSVRLSVRAAAPPAPSATSPTWSRRAGSSSCLRRAASPGAADDALARDGDRRAHADRARGRRAASRRPAPTRCASSRSIVPSPSGIATRRCCRRSARARMRRSWSTSSYLAEHDHTLHA